MNARAHGRKPLLKVTASTAGAILAALLFFSIRCSALDFADFPMSGEIAALAAEYDAMGMADRGNGLPERIAEYVAENPEDPLGHYLAGLTAMDSLEYEEALDGFGAALGLAPEFADAHAQSAMALLYSRRTDPAAGATATLELASAAAARAVAISPRRPDLYVIQASVAAEARRFDIAAQAMEACVLLAPGSVTFHMNLGSALLDNGMPQRALEAFNLAYILNSESNPQAVENRAHVLDTIAPLVSRARREIKEIHLQLESVNKLRESREYLQAAARALELSGRFPNNTGVLTLAAITRMEAFQDTDAAAEILEKAVAQSPLDGNARESLCSVRQILERNREEENLPGEMPQAAFDFKQCLVDAADAKNAASLLEALFADPGRADWMRQIGDVLARLERPDRALPFLHAAALLSPGDAKLEPELERVRVLALARAFGHETAP